MPTRRLPSWLLWPPNCCETCTGWRMHVGQQWIGLCQKDDSLNVGLETDARYRCPSFVRKVSDQTGLAGNVRAAFAAAQLPPPDMSAESASLGEYSSVDAARPAPSPKSPAADSEKT